MAALVVIMLGWALTGCGDATEEKPMTMTLEQAKQAVWETEDALIALVPEAAITQRWPRQETSTVLFECSPPSDGYYWPGGAQLGIDPATDSGAVLTAIHDAWAEKPGWQVSWLDEGSDGQYHLDLLREDGLHFGVMNIAGNSQLHFAGFSPCFQLDDYDPNRSY